MTEAVQDFAPRAADGVTAGRLLRRARETAGMHIAAVAVSLKVPVRKLEALEEDRYELLPDMVFTRSLASSVCRVLKTDPRPVLDRLPQNAPSPLVRATRPINQPFRSPGDGATPTWLQMLTRPASLAVIVLLLAAAVIVVLPISRDEDKPAARPAKPAPAIASAAKQDAVKEPAAVPAPFVPAPQETASAAAPSAAASATPAVVAADPAAAADGIVVIRAKAESWVEVTDAKGVVAVRKVLASGETAGASGALPMRVTLGRADAIEVQVRGKPFDLRPVSRDNVARFEVK